MIEFFVELLDLIMTPFQGKNTHTRKPWIIVLGFVSMLAVLILLSIQLYNAYL